MNLSTPSPAALDPRTLRDVFGRYATGVAVVTTTCADGRPIGVTVNSFTSVSLDPPLVLFCLLLSANNLERWRVAQHFTINVLTEQQVEQSNAFARPNLASWDGVPHGRGDNGCPRLNGALATIECTLHQQIEAGDHLVIVGRVTQCEGQGEAAPLLYYRGRYAHLDVHVPSR